MHPGIAGRIAVIGEITQRLWFRIFALLWCLSGVWDLALSQFVPEHYAKRLPKIYQVLAVTIGVVPWEAWLLVGLTIIAAGAVEYAFRHKQHIETVLASEGQLAASETTKLRLPSKSVMILAGALVVVSFAAAVIWWLLREPRRSFVSYVPVQLIYLASINPDQYRETMDIYIGKWTRQEFASIGFPLKKDCDLGRQCVINVSHQVFPNVHMSFDAEKWEKTLIELQPNKMVTIVCQIKEVTPTQFYGRFCEIEP